MITYKPKNQASRTKRLVQRIFSTPEPQLPSTVVRSTSPVESTQNVNAQATSSFQPSEQRHIPGRVNFAFNEDLNPGSYFDNAHGINYGTTGAAGSLEGEYIGLRSKAADTPIFDAYGEFRGFEAPNLALFKAKYTTPSYKGFSANVSVGNEMAYNSYFKDPSTNQVEGGLNYKYTTPKWGINAGVNALVNHNKYIGYNLVPRVNIDATRNLGKNASINARADYGLWGPQFNVGYRKRF